MRKHALPSMRRPSNWKICDKREPIAFSSAIGEEPRIILCVYVIPAGNSPTTWGRVEASMSSMMVPFSMHFLSSNRLCKDSVATWGLLQRSPPFSTFSSNLIHLKASKTRVSMVPAHLLFYVLFTFKVNAATQFHFLNAKNSRSLLISSCQSTILTTYSLPSVRDRRMLHRKLVVSS